MTNEEIRFLCEEVTGNTFLMIKDAFKNEMLEAAREADLPRIRLEKMGWAWAIAAAESLAYGHTARMAIEQADEVLKAFEERFPA